MRMKTVRGMASWGSGWEGGCDYFFQGQMTALKDDDEYVSGVRQGGRGHLMQIRWPEKRKRENIPFCRGNCKQFGFATTCKAATRAQRALDGLLRGSKRGISGSKNGEGKGMRNVSGYKWQGLGISWLWAMVSSLGITLRCPWLIKLQCLSCKRRA